VPRGEVAGELEVDPRVIQGKIAETHGPGDETLALEEQSDGRGEGGGGEKKRAAPPHRLSRTNV
jgi:hypothetical protein